MRLFVSFVSGVLFAAGLAYGGMTQVHIVKGFLNIFGEWDPRLIGVMGGAIAVHATAWFLLIRKRSKPVLNEKFHLPEKTKLTPSLVIGALIFGFGWGWAGICPGPGLTAAATFQAPFLVFVLSMFVGMWSYQAYERRRK